VSPAENSEVIMMPFVFRTRVGPAKDLLHIADHFGQIPYCVHFHLTQYSLLVLFVFRIDALYSVRLFYCIVPSVTLCIALSL